MFGACYTNPVACWVDAEARRLETGKDHVVCCHKLFTDTANKYFRSCATIDLKEADKHGYIPYEINQPFKLINMDGGLAIIT